MKYGNPVSYWLVKNENEYSRFTAFANSEGAAIDDLDSMRRWIISDPSDPKKFDKLLNKYWK